MQFVPIFRQVGVSHEVRSFVHYACCLRGATCGAQAEIRCDTPRVAGDTPPSMQDLRVAAGPGGVSFPGYSDGVSLSVLPTGCKEVAGARAGGR